MEIANRIESSKISLEKFLLVGLLGALVSIPILKNNDVPILPDNLAPYESNYRTTLHNIHTSNKSNPNQFEQMYRKAVSRLYA